MKHILSCIIVCIAAGSVLGVAGQADMDDAAAAQREYCEAVAQWNTEARRGVPEARRYGRPDYNKNAAEVCHAQ